MRGLMKTAAFAALAFVAGCAAYSWKSTVPEQLRSVAVPTFRNDGSVTEAGAVATRQLLREFQREGTFKIAGHDDCAIEIQGVIKSASGRLTAYNRRDNMRAREYQMVLTASISVIDKRKGTVVVNNRIYTGESDYVSAGDTVTDRRDAVGRAAEDLARKIVDDVLNLKWEGAEK